MSRACLTKTYVWYRRTCTLCWQSFCWRWSHVGMGCQRTSKQTRPKRITTTSLRLYS